MRRSTNHYPSCACLFAFIPKAFVSFILIKLLSYLISFHVLLYLFLLPSILFSLSFLSFSFFERGGHIFMMCAVGMCVLSPLIRFALFLLMSFIDW